MRQHRIDDADLIEVLRIARVYNGRQGRDYVFLLVMVNTGLRVSEAIGIDLEDCYGLERIPAFFSVRTAKRKKPVRDDVFLAPEVAQVLRRFVKKRLLELRPDAPLFASRQARRMSVRTAQRIFKKYAGAICGKDRSVHDLRHTFASRKAGAIK